MYKQYSDLLLLEYTFLLEFASFCLSIHLVKEWYQLINTSNNAYQKKYENIAESDDATVETLKSSSIKNLAFIEVFDKLKQQYPTIDTDSYKEFTTAMEENSKLYEDTKNDINSTVINDYLAANDLSADRCQWNLNYTTKKIDLYETVSSAAETE